jgi:hypothetical protein
MKTLLLTILAFTVFSLTPTKAQFLGIPTGDSRDDIYVTGFGFVAAANAPVVDYVGYFINPDDTDLTLQSAHSVGIYTLSGTTATLVEQALIPAGETATSNSGSYAWVQLSTPVTLTAGLTYAIVTSNGNGDYWNGNNASITVNDPSYGTLTSGGYNQNQGSSFATTLADTYSLSGANYYGGNIASSVTPEPSTWALMLSGLAVLVVGLRLRKRSL